MKKTKVYYIRDIFTDDIIAISEFKDSLIDFYLQNEYNINRFVIGKAKGKEADKYLIKYESLYVESYTIYGITYSILSKESLIIDNIIDSYIDELDNIVNMLSTISDKVKSKEKESIDNTIDILTKYRNKKLYKLIDIRNIVKDYYTKDYTYKSYKDMEDYNKIHKSLI